MHPFRAARTAPMASSWHSARRAMHAMTVSNQVSLGATSSSVQSSRPVGMRLGLLSARRAAAFGLAANLRPGLPQRPLSRRAPRAPEHGRDRDMSVRPPQGLQELQAQPAQLQGRGRPRCYEPEQLDGRSQSGIPLEADPHRTGSAISSSQSFSHSSCHQRLARGYASAVPRPFTNGQYILGLTFRDGHAIGTARSFTTTTATPHPHSSSHPGATPTPATTATPSPTKPKPKRPSPYRIPSLSAFTDAFAPLHAAGWRAVYLDSLEGSDSADQGTVPPEHRNTDPKRNTTMGSGSDSDMPTLVSPLELQDRCLVRAYPFPQNKEGWRRLMELVAAIGHAVEGEDHHPTIIISPYSDWPKTHLLTQPPTSQDNPNSEDRVGYVLYLRTRTHTPMPPLPAKRTTPESKTSQTTENAPGSSTPSPAKLRPGVTTKDLRLAARVEDLWAGLRAE